MSKRVLDLFGVFVLLPIVIIPYLIISILIKLTSKGPVLHWSDRIGQNNIIYKMPKFRTMYIGTPDVATHLLKDPAQFITPLGKVLRKTSLDELPQLWSVINSSMSFVGPRPALHNQFDLKELRTKEGVHLLKPGIIGWAQVNGRDEISIEQKVVLDS